VKRSTLIEKLAATVAGVIRPHPIRVGIDGVDGVGKTTLTDELAEAVSIYKRPVIRASVDGFHNTRSVRYRLGRNSPEGYFRDSFNYAALSKVLLAPLGPGGTRRYRRAVFDYKTDTEATVPFETASEDSILLFDGVCSHWDLSIFLDAPFEVTIPRASARDGSPSDVNAPENRRYVEGQQLYLQTCEPRKAASIVINYADLSSPEFLGAS
jgi:uridine kinase